MIDFILGMLAGFAITICGVVSSVIVAIFIVGATSKEKK